MSDIDNTPQTNEKTTNLEPGYILVETGSTKHPDAKHSEDGKVVAKTTLFVGETLEDAVEKYGEEFVLDQYVRSVTVSQQGRVRRDLDNGIAVSRVEELHDDADPTETGRAVKDPMQSAMSAWAKMSEEDRAALLAQISG